MKNLWIIIIFAAIGCGESPVATVAPAPEHDMMLGYWRTWQHDDPHNPDRSYLLIGWVPIQHDGPREAVVMWEQGEKDMGIRTMLTAKSGIYRHDSTLIVFQGQEYIPVVNEDEWEIARKRIGVKAWMQSIGGPRL